jgi:hypothetical protein
MKITLFNDFHGTSVNLIVKDGKLSQSQMKRAKSELCCHGCTCSGDLGTRGRQEVGLEDIFDSRRGVFVGAYVHGNDF